MRAGVLVSGNNLVLQMVRRVSAGNYTCAATNTLTTTTSNTVLLDIKCEYTETSVEAFTCNDLDLRFKMF